MKAYMARKPCRFGGESYKAGSVVPLDKVDARKAGQLVRMGYLRACDVAETATDEETPAAPKKARKRKAKQTA